MENEREVARQQVDREKDAKRVGWVHREAAVVRARVRAYASERVSPGPGSLRLGLRRPKKFPKRHTHGKDLADSRTPRNERRNIPANQRTPPDSPCHRLQSSRSAEAPVRDKETERPCLKINYCYILHIISGSPEGLSSFSLNSKPVFVRRHPPAVFCTKQTP